MRDKPFVFTNFASTEIMCTKERQIIGSVEAIAFEEQGAEVQGEIVFLRLYDEVPELFDVNIVRTHKNQMIKVKNVKVKTDEKIEEGKKYKFSAKNIIE